MFYASNNVTAVAFETKAERDKFVAATWYETISANEARSFEAFDSMKSQPKSIFDDNGKLQGVVWFDIYGECLGINEHAMTKEERIAAASKAYNEACYRNLEAYGAMLDRLYDDAANRWRESHQGI